MATAEKSLKDQSPYPYYQPDELKLMIISDMLYTMRRWDDSDFDRKVAEAYKSKFRVEMMPNIKLAAKFLHGAAGHGKTQSTVAAFKEVCGMVGLTPIINPHDGYIPSMQDGVMVVSNLSGVISSLEFKGMPVTREYEGAESGKQTYLTTVPKRNYVISRDVGFYALFFDDVSNASENVQNAVMDVVETKRAESMDFGKNAYMILSGNYGADDGSYTVPPSLPKLSRMEHIHFEDDKPSFIKRVEAEFGRDKIGDAGVLDYLRLGDSIFAQQPFERESNLETYACPRTWHKLINGMRELSNLFEGGVIIPSTDMIVKRATGLVGKKAGLAVGTYIFDVITNVQPIAKEFIEKGNLSEKLQKDFESKYTALGMDSKQQQFGYRLCASLAKNASSSIAINGEGNKAANIKVFENFCRAMVHLHPSTYPLAFTWLSSRLAGLKEYHDPAAGMGLDVRVKEDIIKTATAVFMAAGIIGNEGDRIMDEIRSSVTEHKAHQNIFRTTNSKRP